MGYIGYSKSVRAYEAEREGRMTATTLGKVLGCSASAIRKNLVTSEGHHTSSWYNETLYYDEPLLLAVATKNEIVLGEYDPEEVLDARRLLETLRAYDKRPRINREWTNCQVEWLEWSGPKTRRRATQEVSEGCKVRYRGGSFLTITTQSGKTFRKKIGSNGFVAREASGRTIP